MKKPGRRPKNPNSEARKAARQEKKEEKVYRIHVVTDQGNGGAHCSNCGHDLTSQINPNWKAGDVFGFFSSAPNPCPGCGKKWEDTEAVGYGFGGSDF